MEELVKYIVCELVDNKDAVEVQTVEESEKVTVMTVLVSADDIGRVIGRNGKIAGSIRTIAKSGKRYIVKIGERD